MDPRAGETFWKNSYRFLAIDGLSNNHSRAAQQNRGEFKQSHAA